MSFDYQPEPIAGKAIIITGGTTGIGRATAQRLAAEGAKVLMFGRHDEELQDALKDIESTLSGGRVVGLVADAGDPDDINRVFEEADEKLGGVDILINNAAESAGSILETEYSDWQSIVDINLLGYMAACRKAIDRMRDKHDGIIVNIGSISAKRRSKGDNIYVATKSAVRGFTESLSKEVNELGIRVTLIEPGLVGTDMTVEQVAVADQPVKEDEGSMLKAEDIAEYIRYVLAQPKRCDVSMIQIRPVKQAV